MKRLVKWMGILISVLFLSGSAWAYNAIDHVTVAPNGKGDLLFFKYYVVANGGWETKISVTNTNMAASVVAKVVFRSYKNSTELLDFLIYLSPADVWTAKLYWDGTQTKIYSEDSSCLNQNGTFASAADPLDYALKTIGTSTMPFCPDDSTAIGYAYVVQSAYAIGSYTSGNTTYYLNKAGVPKSAIKAAYEASSGNPFIVWTSGADVSVGWNNSLLGYEVFQNATLGLFSSAVQAQALKNYKSEILLQLTATNRLGAKDEANNTLAEIEAALAKEAVALPYVEGTIAATVHVIGFPTKYTKKQSGTDTPCDKIAFDGPFFAENTTSYRVPLIDVKVWDVNEVYSSTQIFSPSPTAGLRDEVNLIAVSTLNADDFPEGWISYPFYASSSTPFVTKTTYVGDTTTVAVAVRNAATEEMVYEGVPVLSAAVFFGAGDSYAIDGAWSDSEVTVNAITYPYYQGQDFWTIH